MIFKILTILSVLALSFQGCLNTDFEDPITVFNLSTSIDESETTLNVGEVEIRILSIRYMVDNIEIEAQGENEIFNSNPQYIAFTNNGLQNNINIGSGEIFGGSYTGVSYDLALPPNDNTVTDAELVERNNDGEIINTYSYVITGIYNSEAFTIKPQADSTYRVSYSFDRTIEMPEKLGTLNVNLLAEWKEWFLTNNRESVLNPADESDAKQIQENFRKYFTAHTAVAGEL